MMALATTPREWVTFNHDAQTYETPDGTSVPAELVDGANCFADILYIAIIRAFQRQQRRLTVTPETTQLGLLKTLAAQDEEIKTLRAQVEQYKEDAERLDYVLRKLPGSILRSLIGTMSDTGDIDEFRAAIDKARKHEAGVLK